MDHYYIENTDHSKEQTIQCFNGEWDYSANGGEEPRCVVHWFYRHEGTCQSALTENECREVSVQGELEVLMNPNVNTLFWEEDPDYPSGKFLGSDSKNVVVLKSAEISQPSATILFCQIGCPYVITFVHSY